MKPRKLLHFAGNLTAVLCGTGLFVYTTHFIIEFGFNWEVALGYVLTFFLLCNIIPHYNTKGDTLFELWIEAKKAKFRREIKAG